MAAILKVSSQDYYRENVLMIPEAQNNFRRHNLTENLTGETNGKTPTTLQDIVSMSDTISSSECDFKIGYPSDEIESKENASRKLKKGNKDKQRKKMNRKYYELRRSKMFSNDSDTTIDGDVVNVRRNRGLKMYSEKRDDDNLGKVLVKPKEEAKTRNDTQKSWTDSGISMSKPDSRPSTLGERTLGKTASSRKLSMEERLLQDGRKNQQKLNKYEEKESRVSHGIPCNDIVKEERNGRRLRKARSKSVPVYSKNEAGMKVRLEKDGRGGDVNRKEVDFETHHYDNEAEKQRKESRGSSMVMKSDNIRCPEIIKKAQVDREYKVNDETNEREAATQTSPIPLEELSLKDMFLDDKNDLYTEKESEIIEQLMRNAKLENSKESSNCSRETISSVSNEKLGKSKMEKLKELFKIKRKTQVSKHFEPVELSVSNARDSALSPADLRFPRGYSLHSTCNDHLCFCDDLDDDVTVADDQLANLGRTVREKKLSFFRRLFSRENRKQSSQEKRFRQTNRRQSLSDLRIQRKRSGSTRSLPEALRDLWIRTRTNSLENFPLQQNQIIRRGKPFERSPSNYSLQNYQFLHCVSNVSGETNTPLSPVRRSRSLRSLHISGNCDIATHLLQPKIIKESKNDNNNMFCHSYFQGLTNQKRVEDHNATEQEISYSKCQWQCCCSCSAEFPHRTSSPLSSFSNPSPVIFGEEDLNHAYVFSDHYNHGNAQNIDHSNNASYVSRGFSQIDDDECAVLAPLSIKTTQKKRAEKIRLK